MLLISHLRSNDREFSPTTATATLPSATLATTAPATSPCILARRADEARVQVAIEVVMDEHDRVRRKEHIAPERDVADG